MDARALANRASGRGTCTATREPGTFRDMLICITPEALLSVCAHRPETKPAGPGCSCPSLVPPTLFALDISLELSVDAAADPAAACDRNCAGIAVLFAASARPFRP